MSKYKLIILIMILALCLSSCSKNVTDKEALTDNVTPINETTPNPDSITVMPKPIEENKAKADDDTTIGSTTEESADTKIEEPNSNKEEAAEDDITIEEKDVEEEITLAGKEAENQMSMEVYKKFLNNEAKISFDRYMPKRYIEEALFKKGCEYTLSEVLNINSSNYLQHTTNKTFKSIDYSYIDCGKDGVSELALRFNGMNIYSEDDDSTLVYIIKSIDGKLSLCYYYETWARSESIINKYGYYWSAGSNGASNHSSEYGLIDKNGNWQFIVSMESELNINQLAWSDELGQLPKIAETKGVSGGIELNTIKFADIENATDVEDVGKEECFYTFSVYDDNWEPIEDKNLYTNSIYKEIFDEAMIPFIKPDELANKISEKEEKVGATAEIKERKEITWQTLNEDMFSDYVGNGTDKQIKSNLCKDNEEVVYSFMTIDDQKIVSLCVDNVNDYIVFRYGTNEKIEIEYPDNLKDSWNDFAFCYYLRGGGPENEGLDLNFITFNVNKYSYILYEKYYASDNVNHYGIKIINNDNGDENDLIGSSDSVVGTLINFRGDSRIVEGTLVDSLVIE